MSFRFVSLNDLHFRDAECERWLSQVVDRIAAVDPALCLLGGDLVDRGAKEDLQAVSALFSRLGVPVRAVPGNHDYGPAGEAEPWDEVFPGSRSYAFEHESWQFLGLDTTCGPEWDGTEVQPEAISFLRGTVPQLDPRRPTVVFTHFPLAPGVPMTPFNAHRVRALLQELDLQAVLSGHYHAVTEHRIDGAIYSTSRCCSLQAANHDGDPDKGFLVFETNDGKADLRLRRHFERC
jgi:3',5'-cyclic AMP phosphodiesterase CpdA